MKFIKLTQDKEAIVDDEDYEYLNQILWHFGGKNYAVRRGSNNSKVMMHRIILKAPIDRHVDHINGNRLDNRKENLRLATRSQNATNASKSNRGKTSKYKGVSKSKRNNKFKAQVIVNGKYIHLGYFEKENDAAKEYNKAALTYFGEYVKINIIED